ncbi:MAG TPA: hypothetical protein DCP73_13245 [Chloroflexi bacterium]|nr:hypothetical protein [Chloroflexota bacterium]
MDRYNSRLPPQDGRRVRYLTSKGRPMYPGQWSGNPWTAPVLLLLLNPAFSDDLDEVYGDPEVQRRVEAAVRGQWDDDYPLPWLHPAARARDPWCANIPFAALHRHLTSKGEESEAAWRRISRKCAVLELGPWASYKWSSGAIGSTTSLSIRLAAEAMADPSRVVLLGRGEDDWKTAGLIDADLLPKSRGVRVNQSRITPANFPETWRAICAAVEK